MIHSTCENNTDTTTWKWKCMISSNQRNRVELQEALTQRRVESHVAPLHVGDYAWDYGPKRWVLLESKTVTDLVQSLVDGRYRDQTARLLQVDVPFVFYILVGDWTLYHRYSHQRQNVEQAVASAMVHVQLVQKVRFVLVPNEHMVADVLVAIHKHVSAACEMTPESLTAPWTESVELRGAKRKGNSQSIVFAAQLTCIEGVSEERAIAIMTKYPSWSSLLEAYHAVPEHAKRESMLASIRVPTRTHQKENRAASTTRCLGLTLSRRIYKCVMGDPPCNANQVSISPPTPPITLTLGQTGRKRKIPNTSRNYSQEMM